MSSISRVFAGILLVTVVGIELGGYFLLKILQGKEPKIAADSRTFSYFRAGHAHAGVLVILALAAMPYVDAIAAAPVLKMAIRVCFGAAPILIPGGFFGGGGKLQEGRPGSLIALVYVGALVLAAGVLLLGVNLLRV
jgi:hypothetical protein